MGGKVLAGIGTVLLAVAGGVWWAVAASAMPAGPAIGPALVVIPGTARPPISAPETTSPALSDPPAPPPSPSDSANDESDGPSPSVSFSMPAPPQTVDPQWARSVDDDEHDEEHDEEDSEEDD